MSQSNNEASASSFDTQVGGNHYSGYKIQPIVFIAENGLDFFQGSVLKYILRYKKKNGIQDLEKARHYIDMMIEMEKAIAAEKVRDHSGSTDSTS